MHGLMNLKYFPSLFKDFLCLFCFLVWFPCFVFRCFASGPSGWPFVWYGYAVIFVIQLELYQWVWTLAFPLLACASVEVERWTAVRIVQDYCVNTQPEDVNSRVVVILFKKPPPVTLTLSGVVYPQEYYDSLYFRLDLPNSIWILICNKWALYSP